METIENSSQIKNLQESLQPQRINPEEKAYQGVRDIAERLRLKDATNIALTGPYGSGKSSILITLKADFPNYKYLNISLATLQASQEVDRKVDSKEEDSKELKDRDGESITKNNLDRLIEYSILQQLVYREKQTTLPDSRLKRIFHLSTKKVKNITWATILAVVALVVLFEPSFLRVEWICELLGHKWLNIVGDTLSLFYLIWYGYKGLRLIVPALANSKLNKVNIKSGEIEIVENTSIFNKHLDEILYFFERTEYDVVILEDLDRFKSTEIFLKLRELNLLLNESRVIDRTIFFIYAVKDDMFIDADRVKCFDYITTVIPVINRSNAKDQLKTELEKRGVTEIKGSCLQELGFFLHDMRLLKNIANEYVQYREKLSNGISCEKLLAMIVYKNYYPKDFADLHDCKGIVYQLINLKEEFITEKIATLDAEKLQKQEQAERRKKERHLKETELRRIYVDAYRDGIGNHVQRLKVGDNLYELNEIAANEKIFNQLISNPSVGYTYTESSNGYYRGQTQQATANLPFSNVEKVVDPSISFSKRLESLRLELEEFEDGEIFEIKKEDVRAWSLSQIMSEVDYQSNPKYVELKVPKLIEYLVVKGYIDENYYDYISYFYGNFIDAHDWEFVLDVKLGRCHPYDYAVNNAEACLAEIPSTAYRTKAILNVGLVDYLAEHQNEKKNATRQVVILRTVVENKKYDFLSSYLKHGRQQEAVFASLFDRHKDLWPLFEQYDNNEVQLKLIWYKYAERTMSCEKSRAWLSQNFAFITDHLLDVTENQWCELIANNDYAFVELNGTSNAVLKTVAERNAYTLNRKNVETLVSFLLDMNCEAVSYRLVCETEHQQLIERVESELGVCLNSVFAAPESEKESTDAIVGILYSVNATDEEKIAYLNKQQQKINLDVVEFVELKKFALKCNVVEPSWENVIHYMNNVSEKKADETLLQFIETNSDTISSMAVPKDSQEDEEMLLQQLIKTDSLSFETYCKVIKRFTRWRFKYGVASIEDRRVLLMIDNGMVSFTQKNTESLIANYSTTTVIAYLIKNKNDFLAQADSVEYSNEDALALMKSSLLIKEKAQLIPFFDSSILDAKLADEILAVLVRVEVNLDLDFLLQVFSMATNADNKIIVLNYTLSKNDFDDAIITSFLETLPDPYKYIAEKGRKPELPNTEQAKTLVKLLKFKNYISSYNETKSGIRVNTKLK